jgi:hypothetical protein
MKKLFWLLTLVLNFVAGTSAAAQQPPLVDRSLFFGEIQIAGAQVSPDGQYISFLKPYKGKLRRAVKR